jgi:predicted HTH transcriptional regulator
MAKSLHIQRLIEQGEHQQLDFKFEISDAMKIAKTFVAFANTDGGTLLIGVKDNGAIAGVRSEEEKFMAESAARMYCKPSVAFTSKEWIINKKVVLEVIIPKGEHQPYMAKQPEDKWRTYIRVGDQNILANKILVKALKRKNSTDGTYINYTDKEKLLLEYLEENPFISFSKFRRMAKISPYAAENILINFLALDILDFELTEKETLYKLADQYKQLDSL